jgi:hypothetical protein
MAVDGQILMADSKRAQRDRNVHPGQRPTYQELSVVIDTMAEYRF